MIKNNDNGKQGDYDHFVVADDKPLLEWLLENLKGESKSKIKATLKGHGILVNGKKTTQFDHLLKKGDKLSVSRSKKNNERFRSRHLKLVYEDRYLVVVEKNVGVLSMAAGQALGGGADLGPRGPAMGSAGRRRRTGGAT